ncbi:MAG: M20/M25/M40 family metallo-hydrolase [Ignavibacteriae bacterium]|nr:M20/M25/M40 family metallo-hydrolase [Ignavibacteriota bacterium]
MARRLLSLVFLAALGVTLAFAQTFPTDDEVIKNIWKEAMESSQLEANAHELFDVIGPRLVGTPQMKKAHDWAVAKYTSWGIDAKNEEWGKWRGWERGISHIDLMEPRVRSLEGMMLAWSPSSKKGGTTAGVVMLPDFQDSLTSFQKWLPSVKGKFVMLSAPNPSGRPDTNWASFAKPASLEKIRAERREITQNWQKRLRFTGVRADTLQRVLEQAGAVGIITCNWTGGWGTNRVFGTIAEKVPSVELSIEDYNLVFRLAQNGKNPVVRVIAESKFLGAVPTFNTIATIKGSEKPNEYVMLSAHFDSWEGGSGTTDNGTGTLMMLEAMRILKKYYPNPKRTIIVGHWGSEEQGLNGSRAFVKDHPDVVENLQALFNQDNGTGRVQTISAQGFLSTGEFLARWLSRVPSEITDDIKLNLPGTPQGGGTDNASFVAAGAPGFNLSALPWDYFTYTWHTPRDTYDKIVFDDLKNNVVLAACLAYLASEDDQTIPRDRRVLPISRQSGQQQQWPAARDAERAGGLDKK